MCMCPITSGSTILTTVQVTMCLLQRNGVGSPQSSFTVSCYHSVLELWLYYVPLDFKRLKQGVQLWEKKTVEDSCQSNHSVSDLASTLPFTVKSYICFGGASIQKTYLWNVFSYPIMNCELENFKYLSYFFFIFVTRLH